jgi:hypothetical protein
MMRASDSRIEDAILTPRSVRIAALGPLRLEE